MNNKKKIIILSSITNESINKTSKFIENIDNIKNDEFILRLDLIDLTTLSLKKLQEEKNVIISKIIFIMEKPKVLADIIAKKLNIRWNPNQAEKYQDIKINETMNRLKKHNIDCEIQSNDYIPSIKLKQI